MSKQTSQGRSAPRRPAPFQARSIVALALTALIAACGGGSDDSSEPDARPANLNEQSLAGAQALVSAAALETGAGWVTVPAALSEVNHGPSVPTGGGQVYYVDSASTATTSAGTLAAPWKTLQEVQSRWSTFQNGDAILLKCGSVWRETLQVSAGGSRPNLLIGAYGDCSDAKRPVIKGSAVVDKSAGWQRYGVGFNHTYVKTVTLPTSVVTPNDVNGTTGEVYPRTCDDLVSPPPVARLFLDGQPLTQARFPNKEDSATGSEFVPLENDKDAQGNTLPNRTSFRMRLDEMNRLGLKKASPPSLVGAIVHIRTEPWEIETRSVQAFDAATGVVTLNKETNHNIKDGSGYILEGKAWLLGKAGQWAYDGGKLYWWPPANKAPKDVVGLLEASHIEAGILAKQIDGLKIERIRFEQHRRTGIDLRGDSWKNTSTNLWVRNLVKNVSVTDVEFIHPQGCGMSSLLADKVTVQDSKVIGAGKYGLNLNPTTNATIRRNLVMDTGLNNRAGGAASGITLRSFTKDFPLAEQTSVGLVEENQVIRTSNTGIFFSNDVGTTVNRNTVIRPCVRLTDCGGIYTFTNYIKEQNDPVAIKNAQLLPEGATVSNNLVVGAKSNLDGSYKPAGQEALAGQDQAVGIYLDELSARTKVIGNTVANTEVGIYLHLARFNTISNNTVVNVSHASFMAAQGANVNGYGDNTINGNQVLNNRFFSHRGVDATLLGQTKYDYDAKPVYAQLWQSTQVSPQTFFTTANGPANVSSGNTTYTTSNVQSKTWRTDPANLLVARHGGVWGVRQNKDAVIEHLGLTAWLQKSGAASESETSPLAFKQFLLAQPQPASLIENGNFDVDTSFWSLNGSSRPIQNSPAVLTREPSAPCNATNPCGHAVAYRAEDFLASKKFSVTTGELYLLRYTVRAGGSGALYRANVRNHDDASQSYAALGFNFLNQLDMAANQEIQVDQFFRASASSTFAVLAMRATDGTAAAPNMKDIYVSQVSLTPISATAMPTVRNQAAESITLVNASDSAVTRTCSDWQLSGANGCNLIDGETRAVIGASTQVTVPARSTKVFFFHKPEWIDN